MGKPVVPAAAKSPDFNLRFEKTFQEAYLLGRDDVGAFARYFLDFPLHKGQIEWSRGKVGARESMLSSSNRWGKAETLDTPIPTANSWTTMKDVSTGDVLFDDQGQPCKVTYVSPVELGRPVYEVVFSDGSILKVSDEHLWETWDFKARRGAERVTRLGGNTRSGPQVRTTNEIRQTLRNEKGQINHSVRVSEPIQGPETTFLVEPYVLGVWLGDGATEGGTVCGIDREIFDEVKNRGYFVGPNIGSKPPCEVHTVYGLVGQLKRLGVHGDKHIPSAYLRASVPQRLALLQGLMDTDGSVQEGGHCEFLVTRLPLAEGAFELMCSLGLKPTWKEERATFNGKDYGPRYRISFTTNLPVFHLSRKLQVLQTARLGPTTKHRYIVDVRPVPTEPVRCIQVDSPSHLYLAGKSFIPTHNTQYAGVDLLHAAFYQRRKARYRYTPQGHLRPYVAINIALSLDQASYGWSYAYDLATRSKKFRPYLLDNKTIRSPFPKMVLGLPNGDITSEIWARSTAKKAKYLLGKAYDRINYDEAAFDMDGEFIREQVLQMRLADTEGTMSFMSSPNGKNWYWRQCMRAKEDEVQGAVHGWRSKNGYFYWRKGGVSENHHISPTYIAQLRETMSPEQVLQNIDGDFADTNSIFPADRLAHCFHNMDYSLPVPVDTKVDFVDPGGEGDGLLAHYDPTAQRHYVMGVDLARKRDKTVIVVLDVTDLRKDLETSRLHGTAWMVAYVEMGKTDWDPIKDEIKRLSVQYNNAQIVADATGVGDGVVQDLGKPPYDLPVTGFIVGSPQAKTDLVIGLQTAIQNVQIRFPYIKSLVESLTYYAWNDKKLFTDPVFALAFAWECAKTSVLKTVMRCTTPEIDPMTALHALGLAHPDDDEYDVDGPAFHHLENLSRRLLV